MKSLVTISVLAFLIMSCGVKFLEPTQLDADRGSKMFSSMNLEKLNQGKKLYEDKCGNCHKLKKLSLLNEAGWRKIVPEMAKGAEMNAADTDLVLQYVLTMKDAVPAK